MHETANLSQVHWPDKVQHARNEGGVFVGVNKGVATFAQGSRVHKFMGVQARNGAASHVAHVVHACRSTASKSFSQMLQCNVCITDQACTCTCACKPILQHQRYASSISIPAHG